MDKRISVKYTLNTDKECFDDQECMIFWESIYVGHCTFMSSTWGFHLGLGLQIRKIKKETQEKLNIYPYVNGITHTNSARLINVHERIAIVT